MTTKLSARIVVLLALVGSTGRIYKLDLTGKVLGTYGHMGRTPGTVDWVHVIACPDERTVYGKTRKALPSARGASDRPYGTSTDLVIQRMLSQLRAFSVPSNSFA